MAAFDENKTYDWDDTVTDDGEPSFESVVLPAGTYPFTVFKVEKGYHNGSDKIPNCGMYLVDMHLDGGDLGTGYARERIYLVEKFKWKAAQMLNALGLKKHGEDFKWSTFDHAEGESGRCKVNVRTYVKNDGTKGENNQVDRYFDKEEQQAKKGFEKGKF